MKITLKKIYSFLFLIGIFFIPFNSFEGINQFGEFRKESGAYFLLLGFLVLCMDCFYNKKIVFPYKNFAFQLLLIFLLWCFLTTVINLPVVYESYYKKTSGINRFIRQYFALILSCIIFFTLYLNVISKMTIKQILLAIRSVFLYSFIVVSVYGFFEILYAAFGIYPAYLVLRLFDYFPFTEYDSDINHRISSVCYEAPSLAIYLITIAGWMFSYIITHKKIVKYLPIIIIFILTYFSGSRTALIVVSLQAVVFFAIILSRKQKIQAGFYLASTIVLFSGFVMLSSGGKVINDIGKKVESLDFVGNLKKNISNQSRFGIQYANLVVFKNNPIIGVGYGQQGYQALYYYPSWAKKNNYEFKQIYLNKKNPMFPPGYNIYIRLLAESGLIGFLIFIYFIYFILNKTHTIIKTETDETKTVAIILLITFIGLAINWFQVDTFRMYGFWLCFAILIRIMMTLKTQLNEK
jgi:O-antigen ligase